MLNLECVANKLNLSENTLLLQKNNIDFVLIQIKLSTFVSREQQTH